MEEPKKHVWTAGANGVRCESCEAEFAYDIKNDPCPVKLIAPVLETSGDNVVRERNAKEIVDELRAAGFDV